MQVQVQACSHYIIWTFLYLGDNFLFWEQNYNQ